MKLKNLKNTILLILFILLLITFGYSMIKHRKAYYYKQEILRLNNEISELNILYIENDKKIKKIQSDRKESSEKITVMPQDKFIDYLRDKYHD